MTGDEQAPLPTEIFVGRCWSRMVPASALEVLIALWEAPLTRTELNEQLRAGAEFPAGLGSSAWEPLLPEPEPSVEQTTRPNSFSETVDEYAERQLWIAELDSHFARLGLPVDHTIGGVLNLLVACHVVLRDADGRLHLNPQAPLPAEVLALDPAEEELQDRMRWETVYRTLTAQLVALFDGPEGQRRREMRASLHDLAERLKADVESIRYAIEILLAAGSITSSVDIERVASGNEITLRLASEGDGNGAAW